MRNIKNNIKKYLLIKHTEAKLKECSDRIEKTIPWIQRKNIYSTIKSHCRVLLNELINNNEKQSLRLNKYVVDSILKYSVERSETIVKSNKKAKELKDFMQLNSYIVINEIAKGINSQKKKKAIKYNIEKQLSMVQEEIESKITPEEILNKKIGI